MPIDLYARAVAQRDRCAALVDALRHQLGEVRTARDRQHPDPGPLPAADWPTALGSAQHVRVAKDALAANDADVARARAGLAAAATPAEAGAGGGLLADLLVLRGRLAVASRDAETRKARDDELVDSLSALLARARDAVGEVDAEVEWARGRQGAVDALLVALGRAPLTSLVADAEAVRTGLVLQAADARLTQLLPSELRARAEERLAEALALGATAESQREKAESVHSDRGVVSHQLDAEVEAGRTAFTEAVAALEAYVSRAPGRLAGAVAALAAVRDHPSLTVAQSDALDPAGRDDAGEALEKEADLASAVAAVTAARVAYEDAVLTALDADPDTDPANDPGVEAAREALEDPDLQSRLDDAVAAYDAVAQAALDRWEVEVPPSLWAALESFVAAREVVRELANGGRRNALVTDVENTGSALADALDVRAGRRRGDLVVARLLAERTAAARAVAVTAAARRTAYLRGDGPSGRTPAEL